MSNAEIAADKIYLVTDPQGGLLPKAYQDGELYTRAYSAPEDMAAGDIKRWRARGINLLTGPVVDLTRSRIGTVVTTSFDDERGIRFVGVYAPDSSGFKFVIVDEKQA